jgi:adenine-specific DNA-methyltransferase
LPAGTGRRWIRAGGRTAGSGARPPSGRTGSRPGSDFCYSGRAAKAFIRLLDNLDAPRILLSYNTEGIIPFEELTEIMAAQGRLNILTRDYTTYRGGRQSDSRKVRNMEFILYLDRSGRSRKADIAAIRRISAARRLERLAEASFDPRKVPVINHGTRSAGRGPAARLRIGGLGELKMPFFFEFSAEARRNFKRRISGLDTPTIERLGESLEDVALPGHIERAEILLDIIRRLHGDGRDSEEYVRSFLWSLKKFAFRKYADDFARVYRSAAEGIRSGELPDFRRRLISLNERVAQRVSR